MLEEKVYAMDTRERLLVVGTADQPAQGTLAPQAERIRKIYVFDLSNPTTPWKVDQSPLQYQTRCLAAYPDNTGYLVGSIEGRVGVQNFDNHPEKQPSYTFKCQRRQLDSTGQVVQAKVYVRNFCMHTQCRYVSKISVCVQTRRNAARAFSALGNLQMPAQAGGLYWSCCAEKKCLLRAGDCVRRPCSKACVP
jgi:hypothetical protein